MVVSSNTVLACCTCSSTAGATSQAQWNQTISDLTDHLDDEMNAQETWMINVLLEDNILPAMMLMTEQLTTVAIKQVEIFGQFLDAKHQLETQRVLEKLQARAHKEYHPSITMCEFGSSVRSLAASERKAELTALVLSQRSLDRQLGSPYTSAAAGIDMDKMGRIERFKAAYCNPFDQNSGLWLMCRGSASQPASASTGLSDAERDRFNKDIDYSRTIDFPWTLNVDFLTSGAATYDEEDVFALSSYLFSHDVFTRPSPQLLATPSARTDASLTDMQKAYLDMRALVAKRSVAENALYTIVGRKAAGENGSRNQIVGMLNSIGITDTAEIDNLLGSDPSYYAQREILTNVMFQNPSFYTNLYDKPANVLRTGAAVQASRIMLKFDTLVDEHNKEMSLATLLELYIEDLQDTINDRAMGTR